jgi:hypothetical protein
MLFFQFIVLPHNYLLRNCYLQQVTWTLDDWRPWCGSLRSVKDLDCLEYGVILDMARVQMQGKLHCEVIRLAAGILHDPATRNPMRYKGF